MKANSRIEILNPETGLYLNCKSVKELKSVFLHSNVIRYAVIINDRPLTFEVKNRIEIGTPALNFIFNNEERSTSDEVSFMKDTIRELQKCSRNWFDKRTKEYKYAFSFANGFNTPLIFEEA
jgi:hypothetical protein